MVKGGGPPQNHSLGSEEIQKEGEEEEGEEK